MFVAGLESSGAPVAQDGPLSPGKDASNPTTGSQSGPAVRLRSESLANDVHGQPQIDSAAQYTQDNPVAATRQSAADQVQEADEFELLKGHLRNTFAEQSSTPKVWPPHIRSISQERGGKTGQTHGMVAWRTLLVDKVRLCPFQAYLSITK